MDFRRQLLSILILYKHYFIIFFNPPEKDCKRLSHMKQFWIVNDPCTTNGDHNIWAWWEVYITNICSVHDALYAVVGFPLSKPNLLIKNPLRTKPSVMATQHCTYINWTHRKYLRIKIWSIFLYYIYMKYSKGVLFSVGFILNPEKVFTFSASPNRHCLL